MYIYFFHDKANGTLLMKQNSEKWWHDFFRCNIVIKTPLHWAKIRITLFFWIICKSLIYKKNQYIKRNKIIDILRKKYIESEVVSSPQIIDLIVAGFNNTWGVSNPFVRIEQHITIMEAILRIVNIKKMLTFSYFWICFSTCIFEKRNLVCPVAKWRACWCCKLYYFTLS